jgi:hypothetical protein
VSETGCYKLPRGSHSLLTHFFHSPLTAARPHRTEQRSIRQEERQYKSDGILATYERKDLHRDLNASSRDIHNEKHDAETRN